MSRAVDKATWTLWWIAAAVMALFFGLQGCSKAPSAPAPRVTEAKELTDLHHATGALYLQDKFGDMQMTCTATVIGETAGGYFMITAAHCVDGSTQPYVSFDDGDEILMLKADIIDIGLQTKGSDWATLLVKTHRQLTSVCIGKSSLLEVREPVTSVAFSLGLGKTEVDGRIELLGIHRPMINKELGADWRNCLLVDINISPGASGALVYSPRQHAAVGIIIGTVSDTHVVVLPIERVRFP